MTEPCTSHESRRILILGATGSIGTSAVDVIDTLRAAPGGEGWQVVGLSAHRRAEALHCLAVRLGVRECALTAGDTSFETDGLRCGPDAAERLVREVARPGDLVLNAIVGAAGLRATLAAIDGGCDVALANKESLVAAGALVMSRARSAGTRLLPVDSEHAAIALCLSGIEPNDVRRVVLTASGGPFLEWPIERMMLAGPEEALAHPNWSMGPKITIDCASLMNKAFELIEAHWLFGLPSNRVDAVVHPQSIVHGFVELGDGAVLAQLARPDMRIPIREAITGRCDDGGAERLDLSMLPALTFLPVDPARFPAVGLARRVMAEGGTSGAVFNAANECAVEAFRAGDIRFGRIIDLVEAALDAVSLQEADTLEAVLDADRAARQFVRSRLNAATTSIGQRSC